MSLVKQFKIGAIVRYSDGITALMKIETVAYDEDGEGNHHYYGRQFYGASMGAYHYDMLAATQAEVHRWEENEKRDLLYKALRSARDAIKDALNNLPVKGECRALLVKASGDIAAAFQEAS